MQFVKPMPFREAVEKIGTKTPIGSAMMSAEWQDVPVALRERAFFSSQVESVRFLQRGRDAIADFLQGNKETTESGERALKTGSRAQFVETMREFALKEGMGPIDQAAAGGLRDITSERRLGLIFNTQTRQANDYGYWRQGMDPDVLNEFPAMRFIRVQEVKQERETHLRFENQVYLKTDPIWSTTINEVFKVPWGPWAWGCGHDVEDVDRDEAERLGLLTKGTVLQPDVQNFNENLRASTKGLDPDLVEKLKEEFGNQIAIEGEEMRWQPRAPEALPVRQSPVSAALEVKAYGALREDIEAGLSAIDRVHDDGQLPPHFEVRHSTRQDVNGYFRRRPVPGGIEGDHIGITDKSEWPTLTTVHETGHLLDLEAIGPKKSYASQSGHAAMAKVLEAADRSNAIQELRRRFAAAGSEETRKKYAYLLRPREIWARGYAQFVTERSGFASLQRDLGKLDGYRKWTAEDFREVSEAIEAMFKGMGWMK